MHEQAYEDARRFRNRYVLPTYKVIVEIGSRDLNGSIRDLFIHEGWEYTGYDLHDGSAVDVVLEHPWNWPEIRDASVDVVLCTQTLEHCHEPWMVLNEIKRIVRPGGLIYLNVPAERPQHDHPVDCFRVYPEGMIGLLRFADLDVCEVYPTYYVENGQPRVDTTGIARRKRE